MPWFERSSMPIYVLLLEVDIQIEITVLNH